MLKIPFFKNTRDNLHCTQAALRSVLKFFLPQKAYNYKYLDRVTAHKKDKFTWNYALLLFLSNLRFEVVYIVRFNTRSFAKRGERYLQSLWTDEIYQIQKKYSDFKQEQILASRVALNPRIKLRRKPPQLSDLRFYFKQGFLLMVPINAAIIEGLKDYSPHMVTITDITSTHVTYHDPGLPPRPHREVSISLFMKAFHYPSRLSGTIIAVRPQK